MAEAAKPPVAADAPPEPDELNRSLHDVMDLMAAKTERLKVMLEYYRLVDIPDKAARIAHLVREIDEREDRLDELKRTLLASGREDEH